MNVWLNEFSIDHYDGNLDSTLLQLKPFLLCVWRLSCTLKISFVNSKKSRWIVPATKCYFFRPYLSLHTLPAIPDVSFLPHFSIVLRCCWPCSRPEYAWHIVVFVPDFLEFWVVCVFFFCSILSLYPDRPFTGILWKSIVVFRIGYC